MDFAERVKRLPPYLFAEMEKLILKKRAEGADLISLSIGDPDLPPPPEVLASLSSEAANPKNHNYSFSQGEPFFKRAVANWYKLRFGVDVNPESEVIALIGSKEGLANITRAFINPGDQVLVPDPSYPVYANGSTLLSEGVPVILPLLEDNDFKPVLNTGALKKRTKLMFLNYPNNPTAAAVDKVFLKEAVDFARGNNLIICYDNAYSEITFDGYRAPSILEVEGALDVALEFHSCSKTFSMTGDRIGFAVGNRRLVEGLVKIKSQIDSGPSVYIQKVAAKALETYTSREPPEYVAAINRIYRERRDVLIEGLRSLGFRCRVPKATFYVWLDCGRSSIEFALKLLEVGVVVTPGSGFGKYGESYVRLALTRPKEEIKVVCERMAELGLTS